MEQQTIVISLRSTNSEGDVNKLLLGPVYTMGKLRYFHAVWPLIYTKNPVFNHRRRLFLKTKWRV